MKNTKKILLKTLCLIIVIYFGIPVFIKELINRPVAGQSLSIEESKKRKVFKFEYKVLNNVLPVPNVDTFKIKSIWIEEIWTSEYSYPEITHKELVEKSYQMIILFYNEDVYTNLNELWHIEIDKDTIINGKKQPFYFTGGYKNWIYSYSFFYLPTDSVLIWDMKSGNPSPLPDSITGSKKIGEIKMIKQ